MPFTIPIRYVIISLHLYQFTFFFLSLGNRYKEARIQVLLR